MTLSEETVLLACITVGAVVGFTLMGGTAIGTAVGAAIGVGAGRLLRQRRAQGGHGNPA
jgi:hypothetical protein